MDDFAQPPNPVELDYGGEAMKCIVTLSTLLRKEPIAAHASYQRETILKRLTQTFEIVTVRERRCKVFSLSIIRLNST